MIGNVFLNGTVLTCEDTNIIKDGAVVNPNTGNILKDKDGKIVYYDNQKEEK